MRDLQKFDLDCALALLVQAVAAGLEAEWRSAKAGCRQVCTTLRMRDH